MDNQQFSNLCRTASLLLDLPDPDQLGDEGMTEHKGISIAMLYDEAVLNDRLFCYVDIGPIPDAQRERIFERLLLLNLISGSKTSGVYTLDPVSSNAIFCIHLMQPDQLDARQLADILDINVERILKLQQMVLQAEDDPSFLTSVREVFALDEPRVPAELA
jgi:hypothetical protein